VLALCHPIKYTNDPTQLLPRGGGAFLNEVDGNLTAWRHDDVLVDLHHHGKFRGPGFEAMTFRLDKITTTTLTDKKGRLLPTVRAVLISESEQAREAWLARTDEDVLLAALFKNADRSIADFARDCGWFFQGGEPAKSKVQRVLDKLAKGKPKLVTKTRDGWMLTEDGKSAAKKATKTIAGDADKPEKAKAKEEAAPFRAVKVGPAPDGVECVQCQTIGDRPVFKIKDGRVTNGKAEVLHEGCAEGWFKGKLPPQFGP
jgi:hypothetical protein